MRITDWLMGRREIQTLELKRDAKRVPMPQAPPLQYGISSYGRYATKSELVYACIEKKAQAFCDPELVVQKKVGKEWKDIPDHPALQVLTSPSPYDDNESFFRCWTAAENIAGVFYAEIVKSQAGTPLQLYPLRPDWVTPQYVYRNSGPVLDHYLYQVNGYQVKYKPEELLVHRLHSLSSMFAGMSPLAVALASIDADISATEYVRDFYNNDGTPSGILKVTGRNLSDDESQRLKQKWATQYSRGGKNRGGIAILDQNAEYEVIGAKLTDLASEELTSIDETRICMAFGVPPVIIGAYVGLKNVNQKASFKGALEEFWMNTMSPELKIKRKFLTNKFLPFFEGEDSVREGKVRFFWNMANVDAMQEDIDAIHDRVALGYKSGLYTLDEAREKIGLEPVGEELGGDQFYTAPTLPTKEEEEEETLVEKRQRREEEKNILDADTLEKKTFEYEGMILSREPNEYEKAIDLKAISDSFDPTDLLAVVLQVRNEIALIAEKQIANLSDTEIATLTLIAPSSAYKRIRKPIEAATKLGLKQTVTDKRDYKAIIDDIVDRLIDLTVARIVNQVSTAFIDIIAALGVLGEDRAEVMSRFEERSDAPYEGYARQAVNSAVNAGRREGMADGNRFMYSAILDKNTCDTCRQWDGKEAASMNELPQTPNPGCDGMANCRCFIIEIGPEEN